MLMYGITGDYNVLLERKNYDLNTQVIQYFIKHVSVNLKQSIMSYNDNLFPA